MKLRGKFLCWLAVMTVMLCVVVSVGCGGGGSSFVSSDDVTVPDNPSSPDVPVTPDNPETPSSPDVPAAPETPEDKSIVLIGTWQAVSGTFLFIPDATLQNTDPSSFVLTLRKNDNDEFYSVMIDGSTEGSLMCKFDGEDVALDAGGSRYEFNSEDNVYAKTISPSYEANGVYSIGDRAVTLAIVDENTIELGLEAIMDNGSGIGWTQAMQITIKRVN